LGNKSQFIDWIKARIEKYDFAEGVDYLLQKFLKQVPHQGGMRSVEQTDYFISLDMAKELSMVENNTQGKIARRYFIECEKQAKAKAKTPKFNHLSPEVISTLKSARTVQLAMGMNKVQSGEYVNELIQDMFGFDMTEATTGSKNKQLKLKVVK